VLIDAKVADLIDNEGAWNWGLLRDWLPADVLQQLIAIPTPSDDTGDDKSSYAPYRLCSNY
jgi:hypothetical protein